MANSHHCRSFFNRQAAEKFEFHDLSLLRIDPSQFVERIVKSEKVQLAFSGHALFTHVIGQKLEEGGKLIFDHLGDQYFFAQVWMGGSSSGLEAAKSGKEIAAEREAANGKIETVALSAHR